MTARFPYSRTLTRSSEYLQRSHAGLGAILMHNFFRQEVPVTRRMRLAMAFGLLVLFTAASLSAHHAFAPVFDGNKVVNLKGTVTRFEMVNPHSFIYLDVKGENGQLEHWELEGQEIRQLVRLGVGASGGVLDAEDVRRDMV